MYVEKKILSFSLVELIVVIAIIAVLTSIAIPKYRQYSIKSRLSLVLPLFEKSKKMFEENYNETGSITNICATKLQYAVNSSEVTNMSCWASSGRIKIFPVLNTAVFSFSGVTTPRIYMFPKVENDIIIWICGYDSRAALKIPMEYLPENCKTVVYPDLF